MVFSTNQNRQLYVVTESVDSTPESQGQVQVGVTEDSKQLYFKRYGVAGLERTDLVDIDKITYAKITKAEDMATALKTATVSLSSDINDGAPVSGQDYILRIYIYNYLAMGDANIIVKYGAVHAYSGMTAATFYEKLAESLTKNFSREVAQLLTFEATDDGVVITEVEQPWLLGTYQQEFVNFKVIATTITYEGDEVIWAETDDDGYIEVADSDTTVGNGKKIADLEYFTHGERGDQYRNLNWPNSIPTKYEVDPSLEYDILDIHYSFVGDGVTNHASEKDLTFVASTDDNAVLTDIQSALAEYGVTVTGEVTSSTE